MRDVVIIGGGPAGLSAALNGAAEGLNTLLLERSDRLGGQAGTSSRIENYLGWPNGVNGESLTSKAVRQARRLGADVQTEHPVVSVEYEEATGYWRTSCPATTHVSKTVLVATGADYRRLDDAVDPDSIAQYGAPASAHDECEGHDVLVIGGGNSAGQAALNLARIGARVTIMARRPLPKTMSAYLIERIVLEPNIRAVLGEAERLLTGVALLKDGPAEVVADSVFAYIGMIPRTAFIEASCRIVPPGEIRSDDALAANDYGLFVAGDVRHGSFKRVAAAVGEGAIAAASAWRFVYNVKG